MKATDTWLEALDVILGTGAGGSLFDDAYEVDIDEMADGERVVGSGDAASRSKWVYSGDADCVLPPHKISAYHQNTWRHSPVRLSAGCAG
jgi:hypothetical protein